VEQGGPINLRRPIRPNNYAQLANGTGWSNKYVDGLVDENVYGMAESLFTAARIISAGHTRIKTGR